ncbi:MAG: transporter substrate-binding domain-containing protein [Nitrospirales bacterium]|nr:lytic transglycosylase F [Nitrospirales bacterium]
MALRKLHMIGSQYMSMTVPELQKTRLLSCLVLLTSVLFLIPAPESGASQELKDDQFSVKFRQALKPWTGDWDGMVKRNQVRGLVPFSKTFYFLDGGRQRGLTYDLMKIFEKQINKELKRKTVQVQVVFIPVNRDEFITNLLKGVGDIAAGAITITPERKKLIDFSKPFLTNVREIIVTGSSSPALSSLDDLAGKTIHVRKSSSFHEHLVRLNASFNVAGKPEITLVPEEENLEDEDLLEMVNAGLLPMIVMDSPKAEFWSKIFENIRLHPDIAVNTGGEIAWAFRKNSPKLKKVINRFVSKNKKGTLIGNILFTRYLKNTMYVKNALATQERKKFQNLMQVFKKTAGQYGFDWVLAMALGYQESMLDQRKRSPAGAIGVMQLLPSTARDPNVNIPNIERLEPNIHAGVKYLHFLHDRYFTNHNMSLLNQWLFAIASYNAGPARISKLRAEAPSMGLNPNQWFKNVEVVAAKHIGRETVQYVSNIYKYFIAYRLILEKVKKKSTVQN